MPDDVGESLAHDPAEQLLVGGVDVRVTQQVVQVAGDPEAFLLRRQGRELGTRLGQRVAEGESQPWFWPPRPRTWPRHWTSTATSAAPWPG
jgi:hypothetical protein